jgi:hypothetical protein
MSNLTPDLDFTFRQYVKRVFQQFKTESKHEATPTVITILAIIVVLLIQYRVGWIKVGEGWATIFVNVAPVFIVFLIYIIYHVVRAPYELDKRQGKELQQLKTELDELTKHRLVFEIDERTTKISVHETNSTLRIFATIGIRFNNKDAHPDSMKQIKLTLHRGGKEIFTLWALLRISSNGVQIGKESFEGMMIQDHRLTPLYELEFMLGIEDDRIKKASDFTYNDFLRVSMQAGGHQPVLSANLHPYWDAALRPEGTDQVTITGAPTIERDIRRLS